MTVKSLSAEKKQEIVAHYKAKTMTLKQMSVIYFRSARTIGRVIEEAGLATPVPRLKGEAYRAIKLLQQHNLSVDQLEKLLEKAVFFQAHVRPQAALFQPTLN